MGKIATGVLIAALTGLLVALLVIDPSIVPMLPHSRIFYGVVIVVALVILALLSTNTGRAGLRRISITNYLASIGILLCAAAWAWLTAHVLGLGKHFLSAVVVAVPALVLIVTACNIIFVSLYRDLGLAPVAPKKGKKKKKKQPGSDEV